MSESMAGGESSRMWASEVEPAVHSEGRREVTIGVVGTAAANRRIFRVAERMDGSVRLSGAVCEDAGGARQKALQLVADVDVILFSGRFRTIWHWNRENFLFPLCSSPRVARRSRQ